MSLNINMPSYYTQVYGVDNDIYKMCRLIEKSIDVKRYSDTLDSIGIVPIIAPFEKIECGLYKEVKRISLKSKVAQFLYIPIFTVFLVQMLSKEKK